MKAQALAGMVCNALNLPANIHHTPCTHTTPSHCCSVQHACELAASQDGNACLLNVSTDGVSCDVDNNMKINLDYLYGMSNTLALVDNKHNNKNARGQAVTGTSPSSIGSYLLDPWHLKLAGVAQELYLIEDWAADTVVLRLCSPSTISKLINGGFEDVGNLSVLVVTLTFIRLRNFSVNARDLNWKDRCMYQWCSLLWFTSFHTPYR